VPLRKVALNLWYPKSEKGTCPMNRRFQVAVVASSACVVGLLLFGAVRGRSASMEGPYTHLGVYSEVLSRIKADYVEEPDMKAVTLGAINGMLESLDPFASYLNADQYKQYQAAKAAKKSTVGLLLSKKFGYMTVVDSVPGSPAAKAGLSTGDVVESINNVSTRDMPLAFAEILMQGDSGSSIEMSVLRVRKSDPQKVTLVRAPLAYPAVTSKFIAPEGGNDAVGVVTVQSLEQDRVKDVATKVAELEKQGAKRLMLDVRHCATGAPDEGVALANLFMDKGLITYTQGQKSNRQDFMASSSKAIAKLPLVVLTNRSTSGGCEVAAGALLDSQRAQVVGEKTFGDAAVRKAVTLDDGSAVILSVAKYYSPSGKAIQDTGITPGTAVQENEPAAELDDDNDGIPDVPVAPKEGDAIFLKGNELLRKIPLN
jgi:carboxyl-terminal processing protease